MTELSIYAQLHGSRAAGFIVKLTKEPRLDASLYTKNAIAFHRVGNLPEAQALATKLGASRINF